MSNPTGINQYTVCGGGSKSKSKSKGKKQKRLIEIKRFVPGGTGIGNTKPSKPFKSIFGK